MKKKSLWESIKDFFLKLLKLIFSLFSKEEKKDDKELKQFEENIQKNSIKLKELDNITIPDTQSTKTGAENSTSSNDTDNIDKSHKLFKDTLKKDIMDINKLVALTYDEDRIKEIIDEILKEEYDIDVKRTKKVIEENIEKLKEKLIEDIKEKFDKEKEEVKTEEKLKEYLKEEIKKEVEEHPLDIPQYPSKYVIATKIPKKITKKEEKTPIVKPQNIIKKIPKEKKEKIIKKAEETKVAMVKTNEPAIIKPKDRLFIATGTATVIATKVATDLLKPLKKEEPINLKQVKPINIDKPKDETLPKEIKLEPEPEITLAPLKKEEPSLSPFTPLPVATEEPVKEEEKDEVTVLSIEKEIQKEKEQTHEIVENKIKEFEKVDDHKDEIRDNEIAQINKERLVKENEKIIAELKVIEEEIKVLKDQKEDVIVEKTTKEEIKPTEEPKKETPTETTKEEVKPTEEPKKEEQPKEEKAPDLDITDNINSTIANSQIEMKTDKEFEDKEYDQYESEINELLYDIELYKIKYDRVLTHEQKKKLKQEERKLRSAKSNIQYQKSLDIEKERKNLEQEIAPEELQGLQLELKKKHLENKRDLNDELIDKVEDLEYLTDDKVHNLEKKLIKRKLRKALVVTQMGSILALPFIRNKYFFYFTAGLIAQTELMFLGDLFRRKTSEYEPVDLTALKNGRDALNGALNVTKDNIIYLEGLEQTALAKYPELSYDSEYIRYINSLRASLAKTQNKLSRKRDAVDKYIYKAAHKTKKLQQKLDNAA